jgi:hypothetical protein
MQLAHKDKTSCLILSKTSGIATPSTVLRGGGLELAMACHFRMLLTMQNGLAEVSLGVIGLWWNTTFASTNGKDAPWNDVTAGMVAG